MSLIDEALRRARQEASRQDAAKRDTQYRQVPVYAPSQRRGISPALIGAIVALCIVAGIGIGVFLGRDRGTQSEAEETTPAATSPVLPSEEPPSRPISISEETPEMPEPPAEPVPAPTPDLEPVPEEPPRPVREEVPAAEQEPLEPPPAPDPAPTPVAVPETPAPAPQPTPAPAPAPEIRSYVREVPLPDGGTLRLNGIAFSATQPVALINDKVLAKGESYEGFIVTDIQANLVELRGNGMTVRVSLK